MNKADVRFLLEQIDAAMRGEAIPQWRSAEFARVMRVVRVLDELSSPDNGQPELRAAVLRQVGAAALQGLLSQFAQSMCAEANARIAVAASQLISQFALESPPSARPDARGQR